MRPIRNAAALSLLLSGAIALGAGTHSASTALAVSQTPNSFNVQYSSGSPRYDISLYSNKYQDGRNYTHLYFLDKNRGLHIPNCNTVAGRGQCKLTGLSFSCSGTGNHPTSGTISGTYTEKNGTSHSFTLNLYDADPGNHDTFSATIDGVATSPPTPPTGQVEINCVHPTD